MPENGVVMDPDQNLQWQSHHREHAAHERAHEREHMDARERLDATTAAMELRLKGMNEWRAQINEERLTYAQRRDLELVRDSVHRLENTQVPRAEIDSQFNTISQRIVAIELGLRDAITNDEFQEYQRMKAAEAQTDRRFRMTVGVTVGTAFFTAFAALAVSIGIG